MSIRVKDGGYYVRYRDESRKEYSKYLGKGENARRAAEALDNKIKSENKLRRAMKSQNRLLRLAQGLGPISQTTSLYSFEAFKRKIKCLLDDPNMTLGIVFDVIMKDLDLPYTFKDCMNLAKEISPRKMKVPAAMRAEVIIRDKRTCQICGKKAPHIAITLDHIVPVSR